MGAIHTHHAVGNQSKSTHIITYHIACQRSQWDLWVREVDGTSLGAWRRLLLVEAEVFIWPHRKKCTVSPLTYIISGRRHWTEHLFFLPLSDFTTNLRITWYATFLTICVTLPSCMDLFYDIFFSQLTDQRFYTWLASLVAQSVKSLPAMRETWVSFLGW